MEHKNVSIKERGKTSSGVQKTNGPEWIVDSLVLKLDPKPLNEWLNKPGKIFWKIGKTQNIYLTQLTT